MNTGIFGEGFPYSNFHDLNMDWIIKIAKDFLDQYTNIQNIISSGEESLQNIISSGEESLQTLTESELEALQEKATELEGLLQQWYDTHSNDIADALVSALSTLNTTFSTKLNQFDTAITQKGEQTLASIPADYTTLANEVDNLDERTDLIEENIFFVSPNLFDKNRAVYGKFLKGNIGEPPIESTNANFAYYILDIEELGNYTFTGRSYYCYTLDANGDIRTRFGNASEHVADVTREMTTGAAKLVVNFNVVNFPPETYMIVKGDTLPVNYLPYGIVFREPMIKAIENQTKGSMSENIFNPNTAVLRHFINGTTGEVYQTSENTNYFYNIVPIKPNTKYTVSGTSYYYYFLDNDDVILYRGGSANNDYSNYTLATSPATASKLAISARKALFPTALYMVVEGTELPLEYEPYNHYVFSDPLTYLNEDAIYYVGNNRTFDNMSELFTQLTDTQFKKTIIIDEGTYNVFNEIGGASFCDTIPVDATWRDVSVVVPPNTHLIGRGNVVLEFLPTVEQIGNGLQLLSPLNVIHPATIENIKIKCRNCRYAIHDEKDPDAVAGIGRYSRKYIGVSTYKEAQGLAQSFGAGISVDTDYLFDHCVFDGTQAGLSYHTNADGNGNFSTLTFKNCVFKGNGNYPALRFGNVSWHQNETVNVALENCLIDGIIKINNETNYGVQNFDLLMVNTNKSASDVEVILKEGDVNKFPPKSYNW